MSSKPQIPRPTLHTINPASGKEPSPRNDDMSERVEEKATKRKTGVDTKLQRRMRARISTAWDKLNSLPRCHTRANAKRGNVEFEVRTGRKLWKTMRRDAPLSSPADPARRQRYSPRRHEYSFQST